MATWVFEPGHTAAGFRARHMMVGWVRGHLKDVHGTLEFDPDKLSLASVEAAIQANKLWSGEPQRDEHLKSADFLDVERHPAITFRSTDCAGVGTHDFRVSGDLMIRGVSRPAILDLHYVGRWSTPYWTAAGDAGPVTRVGFVGQARLNRQDFGVSWNGQLADGGVVVSDEVIIEMDVEALLEAELKRAIQKGGPA